MLACNDAQLAVATSADAVEMAPSFDDILDETPMNHAATKEVQQVCSTQWPTGMAVSRIDEAECALWRFKPTSRDNFNSNTMECTFISIVKIKLNASFVQEH